MTLVGFTALSVLTSTNAWARAARAASATTFVPNTLFLIASAALCSIIGTCLWAAQWNTTCGRSASKIWRTRCASVASAMSGRTSAPTQRWRSSRSISNSAFSARSTSNKRCGQNRIVWRQISDPMLPPAPVTSTRLPARNRCNSGVSRLITGRRSRSASATSPPPPPAATRARGPGWNRGRPRRSRSSRERIRPRIGQRPAAG